MAEIEAVILGAFLGAGTKWIDDMRERARRRRSVATALLDELRFVELWSRQLTNEERAAAVGGSPAGSLFLRLRDSDDLFLFKPNTISGLLNLAGLITEIRDRIAQYQQQGNDSGLHLVVRQQAGFMAGRVPHLKAALAAEGGTMPPAKKLEIVYGAEIPALPPAAFPEWEIGARR